MSTLQETTVVTQISYKPEFNTIEILAERRVVKVDEAGDSLIIASTNWRAAIGTLAEIDGLSVNLTAADIEKVQNIANLFWQGK